MTAPYTDVFGNQTIPPAGTAYRAIPLAASVSLYWPSNYEGPDYVAMINDVTASSTGYVITLDAATAQSTGFDLIFNNVGSNSFTVKDNSGNTLATVAAGVVKLLYLVSNSTAAGTWRVVTYGTGTSSADASALVGYGLQVIGSTLNVDHDVQTSSSAFTMALADRAQVYVATGGSVAVNLLAAATAGNGFFVGVRNAGSGTVTITPSGVETIDGLASLALAPNESVLVFCTGSAWYSVGYGRSTTFQFTKLVKDVSAGGTITLTTSEAANKLMQFTGNPVSNVTIIVPTVVAIYYIQNAYTGTETLTIKTSAGTGVTLNNTDRVIVYCDAVNVVNASSATVGTNLSVIDGTAGSPSINFSSATTTGIFKATTATLGISSGGTEVARFGTAASIISKLTITAPATSATLTLVTGSTLVTAGAHSLTLTTSADSVVTFPTSGTLVNTAVTTLSSLTSVGTIGTGTWQGTVIGSSYGGTGVNNGSSTITVGGNVTFSGGFTTSVTVTGNTAVTFPTSGTLVNTGVTTLSSLTSVGTIGTGTWQASVIGSTYGGTGVNNGSSTITLAGNLVTSGANSLTLTTSGPTNVTLPTSGTLATTSNKLSAFAATTSAELAGVISDETGSGALVFAGSPTFTGSPLAPTQSAGDNSTKLATTAYVATAVSGGGTPGYVTFAAAHHNNLFFGVI